MICPCCGADNIKDRSIMVCRNCLAAFSRMSDVIEMIECSCSRHDNGKIVRTPKEKKED